MLIVDDSPTALHLLAATFRVAGFDVMTAADGIEALGRIRERRPDVVVTDSLMPRMDGFALLRALRTDPATRAIPVIMLTATDPTDTTRRAAELHPDAVVAKSLALEEVVAEVERLLPRDPQGGSPGAPVS